MELFTSQITEENIDFVINSILPYEPTCVNLTECLKRQKKIFSSGGKNFAYQKALVFYNFSKNTYKQKSFIGIILLSESFVLLHCFIDKIPDTVLNSILNYIIKDFFDSIKFRCLLGESKISVAIENFIKIKIKKSPTRIENYKLLIRKNKKNQDNFYIKAYQNLNADIEFIKISLTDINDLCSMEAAYQKIEVLGNNKSISHNMCYNILYNQIKKNVIYAAKYGTNYIAKAGINASGFFWNQIGGVYTIPKFRNKGIGAATICKLMDSEKQKEYVLFVKIKNLPARKLYQKLGFSEYCDFRISYF